MLPLLPKAKAMREIGGLGPLDLRDEILTSTEPLILRGLVASWPAVKAGLASAQAARDYLRQFYQGMPVVAMLGAPEIGGRYFYNENMSGFNYAQVRAPLDKVFDELADHHASAHPPAIYVGSTTVETCLPGFREQNPIGLGQRDALMSIWIGNRTRIAAHYDLPDNLACVAVGRRRFTLFPPDQLANLYVGPLDFNPAGQAISLVDFHQPDLARFPRFAQAMEHAQVAELGPGDAIFVPSMWWHHVEALEPMNVLINYWWRQSPDYMDTPTNVLQYAIMCVRDLPPAQRKAWQELFRHYVFEANDETVAHIDAHARHLVGPMTPDGARALRGQLLKKINR